MFGSRHNSQRLGNARGRTVPIITDHLNEDYFVVSGLLTAEVSEQNDLKHPHLSASAGLQPNTQLVLIAV